MGDININIADISDSSCSEYVKCFQGNGLECSITTSTRSVSGGPSTLIDHILTNLTTDHSAGVVDFPFTDHFPVFLLVDSHVKHKLNTVTKDVFSSDEFRSIISQTDWTGVLNDSSAIPAFHKLCNKVTDAMKKMFQ